MSKPIEVIVLDSPTVRIHVNSNVLDEGIVWEGAVYDDLINSFVGFLKAKAPDKAREAFMATIQAMLECM